MNDVRFADLLERLLENELSDAEGAELAEALRAEPDRCAELRRHLVLWELWSQRIAPERSAEAFCASWRERLRAEEQPERFLAAVRRRIARETAGSQPRTSPRRWWGTGWRLPRVVWLPSVAMAAIVLFLGVWSVHRAEATVTIRGEAVCPACVLHTGHAHGPAVRVQERGATQVYFLESTPQLAKIQDYFCSGPHSITVEGRTRTEAGRTVLSVSRIELPPAPEKPREDQRPPPPS